MAARTAALFAEVADRLAREHGGRVVKLLGDGALLQFPEAQAAVEASLAVLAAMPGAGLPSGHAGVHAGPLVLRDGDVFGRTVNIASRIADVAGPDELLVSDAAVAHLPADRFALEALGPQLLDGVVQPVEVVRIVGLR